VNVAIPKINKEQTKAFSKVWDSGGIKIILDDTAIKFATDWANIVLRSFIEDQVKKAQAMQKAMQEKNTTSPAAVPEPSLEAPAPSKILLTDS